ncbi:hypothetical protein [Dipodfec virus UOA04_Rod_656]|nr:hypothetical protein [Dipodfec virus UOA04_Rod_656]
MKCHVVISRINPVVNVDSVRFCEIVNGQATPVEADIASHFSSIPVVSTLLNLVQASPDFTTLTVRHDDLATLIRTSFDAVGCTINFFDNNLIIVLSDE